MNLVRSLWISVGTITFELQKVGKEDYSFFFLLSVEASKEQLGEVK